LKGRFFKNKIKKMSKEQVLGIVRHLLTTVGGILIANGLIDGGSVTEIVGSVITLIGVIWSVAAKK
jgi:hypothetical protein